MSYFFLVEFVSVYDFGEGKSAHRQAGEGSVTNPTIPPLLLQLASIYVGQSFIKNVFYECLMDYANHSI
jgi:hypothetical protein